MGQHQWCAFRTCISNSGFPYSDLRRTHIIQLHGINLKVFSMEIVMSWLGLGVRCSRTPICNPPRKKLTYFQALLLSPKAPFLLCFERAWLLNSVFQRSSFSLIEEQWAGEVCRIQFFWPSCMISFWSGGFRRQLLSLYLPPFKM